MNDPISMRDALFEIRNRYGLWSESDEKRLDAKRAAEEAANAAWNARNPEQESKESEESEEV